MTKKIIILWAVLTLISLAGIAIRECNEAKKVLEKELSASSILKKYEYFKDLASAIDEKRATIEVYENQLKSIKDQQSYQYQQTLAEMTGLISMHNRLCAEYNADMSKFNYSFCNKGEMPASNLEPLPREIKPYLTK